MYALISLLDVKAWSPAKNAKRNLDNKKIERASLNWTHDRTKPYRSQKVNVFVFCISYPSMSTPTQDTDSKAVKQPFKYDKKIDNFLLMLDKF